MCPSTGHLLGVHCGQQSYPFQPTPPYYSHSEPVAPYPQQHQQQQQQQQYLATPSSHVLQPQQQPRQDQHFQSQVNNVQPSSHRQQQQLQPQQQLAVKTKMDPTSSTTSPLSSRKNQQQQSISQLADFAAHMVCYLLYGHQPSKTNHHRLHHGAAGTPPSSLPSSPLPGQGSHNSATCLCEVCSHSAEAYSPTRSTRSAGNYSSRPHHLPPPPPPPTQTLSSSPSDRPTHRRIISECDIVQPKPMFRKFCLDVLSATLLSPSVILLSLKYIQQLMINLKESNKIVNTGEGAEYRFFTGALILANKFLDDNTFTNKTWADITGMKIKDVNHLEMQFLSGIEFRLFTSSWQYSEWLAKLTQFTGTYMPSLHEVAYQQQTAAAQSPISPIDSHTTITAAAEDEVLSRAGSGSARDHGHSAVNGLNSSVHPYAVVPTSSLSMASISHYIDSVKHIQQTTSSNTSRFQRVPASTSYHHSSQPAFSSATTPSHQQQYQSQSQNQQQQQQQLQQQQSQPQYNSLPHSASFTSSPSAPPFAYQQRPTEPIHRKRSAIIAFEDIMDRSPRYEPGVLPQSTSQQLPGNTISRHKRFSSSSSVATLMGSLSTGSDSFHNGHSPMIQQQRYQQQQQRPLSSLHQRGSSGALSHSFRAGGHHHRSASGGNFYVDMSPAGSSPYRHEPSTSHVILSMPSNPRTSGVHPLEEDHHRQGYYAASRGSYLPSQHPLQPPQQQPQQQRHSNHRHSYSESHFHSAVSPSYSPNGYDSPCRSMGCNGNINRNNQNGVNPATYEIDPRLWGPLDSLSLYAITTQAAKRVVAQGKALTSSANGLHMYYPTSLA